METERKKRINLSTSQIRFAVATALVVVAMVVMSVGFILRVYFMTESKCYEDLHAGTEKAIAELESTYRNNRTVLRIIAGNIAQEDDLESLKVISYLSTYDVNSLISQAGILLPDNQVIQAQGRKVNMNGMLDFAEETARNEHISGLQPSGKNPAVKVMRNFVPIRKDGKIVALLYSATNPSNVAQASVSRIYEGAASFYVVDRKNGEVVINSSDRQLANINDMDFIVATNQYTKEGTVGNILAGKRGYSVYRTKDTDDLLYMCYLPFSIEDWEMVVFVPESAVFEDVQPIRQGLFILLILVVLLLAAYVFWMIREIRKSIAETERRANIDVLTGLQNRNRYEAYLKELKVTKEKLTCLYIDANGLHELNNTKGHLAGDQMLRFIADTLKVQFGEDHVYRIGGDEFVVFQSGRTETEMQMALNNFNDSLQKNDYHAAVGLCVYGFGMSVDQLIRNAEKEMYEAKRKYYERIGKVMRV